MARLSKGGNFVLKNNLLTIRYWSQAYTTSLFNKKVENYVLVCQYPLSNFNLDILKDITAVQLYLDIGGKVYIARVNNFISNIDPQSIVLQLTLSNLQLKAGYDLEYSTPSVIYEQILSDKIFFKINNKKLDEYVKPLGIIRKVHESDQGLRRRVLEYLNYKMAKDGEPIDIDLKQLRGEKDA